MNTKHKPILTICMTVVILAMVFGPLGAFCGASRAESTYTYDPAKALSKADSILRDTPTSGGRGASYVSSVLRAGGLTNVKQNGAGDLIDFLNNSKNFGGTSIGSVVTDPKYSDLEPGDVLACVCIKGGSASNYTNGHSKGSGKYYGVQVMIVSEVGGDHVKIYAATTHKYNEKVTLSCNGGSYICKCSKCNSTNNVKWIAFCFSDAIKSGKSNNTQSNNSSHVDSGTTTTVKINNPTTISAGCDHTVAVKTDGSVVACGSNAFGQCDVSSWKNIASVAAGWTHTVGLKKDGTVVACGRNNYGQCDVSEWRNIVAVAAGRDFTIGLKADGTVVAQGKNNCGQCNVNSWSNIKAIAAGKEHTVGLKTDNTVVAIGDNYWRQLNVSNWSGIVAIAANSTATIGLKSDGTIDLATNDIQLDECRGWKDIKAIAANIVYVVGLKENGSVVGADFDLQNPFFRVSDSVSGWSNIAAIAVGEDHVAGMTKDGRAVAGGTDPLDLGFLNVSGWSGLRKP